MIANRFADGYDNNNTPEPVRVHEGLRRMSRTPSPREIITTISMDVADPLANRVSFYMDDAVISSNDEVYDISPALSRHPSSKQYPRYLYEPYTRGRSFRVESENRPRLYRHGSDVGPARRFQRTGSRRSGGSCRRAPLERSGSVRSSAVNVRRQSSVASTSRRSQSIHLPHPDLPPKERRRRTVVLIVIITFMFLVICSVLVVVVTLTSSSFHRNPHNVRKENEELLNALTREGTLNGFYNGSATSSPLDATSTPEP